MQVLVYPTRATMSAAAAQAAAAALRRVLDARPFARIAVATAASQIEFQSALSRIDGIEWPRVEVFQLDEYVGLPAGHPARFSQLLTTHVLRPTGITRAHLLSGDDARAICEEAGRLLSAAPLDLAFLGIGENGHLAFNDPPADFQTTAPYAIVQLDETCRRQQVGEGWFATLEDVPTTAVSMTIPQMLSAHELLVIVPDRRKAAAVQAALTGPVSPMVPASILQTHPNVTVFLDRDAASALSPETGVRPLYRTVNRSSCSSWPSGDLSSTRQAPLPAPAIVCRL